MNRRFRLALAAALMLAAIIPAGARAQAGALGMPPEPKEPVAKADKLSNITAYAAYRFSGGGISDVNSGKSWEVTDGPSFAVAADFGIDSKTQWELFVSYRNSSLRASGFSPVAPLSDKIHLGITYYHLGGTYFADRVGKGG